jgi:predicted HD phosphohydrolase
MDQVEFVRMADGTREEYAFLDAMEAEFTAGLVDRLIAHLKALDSSINGYKVSRLGHSLQSATRAHRAGEP